MSNYKNPLTRKEVNTNELFVIFPYGNVLLKVYDKILIPVTDDIEDGEYTDQTFTFDIDSGEENKVGRVIYFQTGDSIPFEWIKTMENWISIIEREYNLK
jgi:hypothetical protein